MAFHWGIIRKEDNKLIGTCYYDWDVEGVSRGEIAYDKEFQQTNKNNWANPQLFFSFIYRLLQPESQASSCQRFIFVAGDDVKMTVGYGLV